MPPPVVLTLVLLRLVQRSHQSFGCAASFGQCFFSPHIFVRGHPGLGGELLRACRDCPCPKELTAALTTQLFDGSPQDVSVVEVSSRHRAWVSLMQLWLGDPEDVDSRAMARKFLLETPQVAAILLLEAVADRQLRDLTTDGTISPVSPVPTTAQPKVVVDSFMLELLRDVLQNPHQ